MYRHEYRAGSGPATGVSLMKLMFRTVALVLCSTALLLAADPPSFEKTVQPLLTQTCATCHSAQMASGGLNIAGFTKASSLVEQRDEWQRILDKMKSGEMPPPGVPRPAHMDAAIQYLQGEFEKADRNTKPDPGRVTARRLNRAEYTNTIRDLLGVEFRAEKNFPADDLAGGFDNMGEVLSVSPVLMDKYLVSAGRIAARAIGADPLPEAPRNSVSQPGQKDSSSGSEHHRSDWPPGFRWRIRSAIRACRASAPPMPSP